MDSTPRAREADGTPSDAEKKKPGLLAELWDTAKTIVFALLIAFVLRVFLFQPFTIPSASMEPTLTEGDYVIVSKFPYGYSGHSLALPWAPNLGSGRIGGGAIDRGDVVVFRTPLDNRTDLIKRVVGLPGDRIQVSGGMVTINGTPVNRVPLSPATVRSAFGDQEVQRYRETLPGPGGLTITTLDYGTDHPADDTGVYVVPAGHYFMMGDNRDNSVDSRYSARDGAPFLPADNGVGFVPVENIVGRADLILASWNPGASLFKPWTWFDLREGRFFVRLP